MRDGRRNLREALRAGAATLLFSCALLSAAGSAQAREAPLLADDPALEARVMAVAEELRCLVCQNETIAASHADLAVDLRNQIRLQIKQGRSEAQIKDYMVQRYGDFVLFRPRWQASTWLLWAGPFVLLAVALLALARNIRRRRPELAEAELSPAEHARAQRLLGTSLGGPSVGSMSLGSSSLDSPIPLKK